MILKHILLVMLALALGCQDKDDKSSAEHCGRTEVDISSDPLNEVDIYEPLWPLADAFDVNIRLINFNEDEAQKMLQAVKILKKVVASKEFRQQVLNHTYEGLRRFVDHNCLSNGEIYQHILSGSESLYPYENNVMDVEVELYYENTTTVGYTYPQTERIWVNKKYFHSYTAAGVAANLMHEWLHKLGYTHAVAYSVARQFSVPYSIGRIVGALGKNYLKQFD